MKADFYKTNSSGVYEFVKTVSPRASNYSTYAKPTKSTSLSSRGRYCVRSCFSGSAKSSAHKSYAPTWGSYHYFTVK